MISKSFDGNLMLGILAIGIVVNILSSLFLVKVRIRSGSVLRLDLKDVRNFSELDQFLDKLGAKFASSHIRIGPVIVPRNTLKYKPTLLNISAVDELVLCGNCSLQSAPKRVVKRRIRSAHSLADFEKYVNHHLSINRVDALNAKVEVNSRILGNILASTSSSSILLGTIERNDHNITKIIVKCVYFLKSSSSFDNSTSFRREVNSLQRMALHLNVTIVGCSVAPTDSLTAQHLFHAAMLTLSLTHFESPLPIVLLRKSNRSDTSFEAFGASNNAYQAISKGVIDTASLSNCSNTSLSLISPIRIVDRHADSIDVGLLLQPVAIEQAPQGHTSGVAFEHSFLDLSRNGLLASMKAIRRLLRARKGVDILKNINVLHLLYEHKAMDKTSFDSLCSALVDAEEYSSFPRTVRLVLDSIFNGYE